MDKLFKTKKNIKSTFKFDKNTADVFDDMLKRSVPFYTETQRMILELTKTFVQDKSSIYDLGCSTGTTLLNLARNINKKDVEIIGIDFSDAMIEKARTKLKKHGMLKRCLLINADLNKSFKIENASVIIMNLTLQFIKPLNRKSVISQIYAGLKTKGCFILIEKIISEKSLLNRIFIKLHFDYKMRKGYSMLEINKKMEAIENILIPYSYNENVELLKNAGFKTIDGFFRWHNFCGIIAIKR